MVRSPKERGLVPIAPGRSVAFLTVGVPIALPRDLDLALPPDRAILHAAVASASDARGLIVDHLDNYLSLFPESHFRRLFHGGVIVVPGVGNHATAFSLQLLLQVTKELKELSQCRGFAALLQGFRNPPQVSSTIFEALSAGWCRTRELTVGIDLHPEVVRGAHLKRPEFRWRTEVGDLFCECKQANEFEAKYGVAFDRLFDALERAHRAFHWDDRLRLDVWIRLGGRRLDDLLRDLLATASCEQRLGRVPWNRDHRLAAKFRSPVEMPPELADTIFGFRQLVSGVERPASPENASFSLTLDISGNRKAVASRLFKEARLQLPQEDPSAVFLSLGGLEAAAMKVGSWFANGSTSRLHLCSSLRSPEPR
jgi:hypothetical protein